MIVVVVVGILASLAIPKFVETTRKSKQAEADQLLKAAYKTILAYEVQYNQIPPTLADGGVEVEEGKYFTLWGPQPIGLGRWRTYAFPKPGFDYLQRRHIHGNGVFHSHW
jgi:type II secretory pathway pseudopilin PulG